MTYGKLSDRCLQSIRSSADRDVGWPPSSVHFVEAVAGGYNTVLSACRWQVEGWRHLFYQLILNRRAASWFGWLRQAISILWSIEYMAYNTKVLAF